MQRALSITRAQFPDWYQAVVREAHLFDAAPDARTSLEHDHLGAAVREVAGGGEPGEAGAQHHDVVGHQRSTRLCSGSQPIRTRWPSVQRSSVRARSRFCSSTASSTPSAISSR